MGTVFESIDESMTSWIAKQKMFFVATAPLAGDGLINCSPKGLDTFRVLDPLTVAYLDFTGSGIETVAHIQENERIVIMFCAFDGAPNIVRLHGKGKFYDLESPRFAELQSEFDSHVGVRGVIEVSVTRIADSCGWGVPKYEFVEEREALTNYATKQGVEGLTEYRKKKNFKSLDGLPGFQNDQ
jgi:hypothetical protein